MLHILTTLISLACITGLSFDFGQKADGSDWQITNDGVMGGLSTGDGMLTDSSLLFEGTVSLENNGGFSSLRSPFQSYDLSAYENVRIKYRSSGVRVGLTFEVNPRFYIPYYKQILDDTKGEWVEQTFKLTDISQYRLLDKTGMKLEQDVKGDIIRVGFITSEKRAGDFAIEIAYLHFE